MKHKLLSITLAAAMAFSAMPGMAFADSITVDISDTDEVAAFTENLDFPEPDAKITEITPTSVTIEINAENDYVIEYEEGVTRHFGKDDDPTITGLTPGTEYVFRLSESEKGVKELRFTTPEEETPEIIDISGATVEGIKDMPYTGKAVTPEIKVLVEGEEVLPDNYDVAFSSNVNVGTASVTVKAKEGSNYTGSVTKTFRIYYTGWQNGHYYDANGNMVKSGWAKDSKGWRWMDANGNVLNGTRWVRADGTWYYIDKGYMVTNRWEKDSTGKWFYLGSNGKMAANTFVKDSHGWAYLNKNGEWDQKTKWVAIGSDWYYVTKGYMVANRWEKDSTGNWFYLGSNGKMVRNTWVKDSHGWCWMGADGQWVKNRWIKDRGEWYLIKADGYMASNQWFKDSHGWGYLGSSGRMLKSQWVADSTRYCWLNSYGYWDKTAKSSKKLYQNPSWMVQLSTSPSKHGQSFYMSPCQITNESTRSAHVEAMISRAYDYLGDPYIVCRSGRPGYGVDCSGLVMQAGYAAGVDFYPSTPYRHTFPAYEYESREIWKMSSLKSVSWANRQRGDLIFYANSSGTVIHIAIYLGNNKIIHSWPGGVRVSSVYGWGNHIKGVKRVFN